MINRDDIQAEENKRREAAVKAGADPIATKYEPSAYKELMVKLDTDHPNAAVEEEFGELVANDPKPGFNFVSGPVAVVDSQEIIRRNQELVESANKDDEQIRELVKEANENELKVTRTATGQPNVDAQGNIVEPIQGDKPGDNPNPSSQPAEVPKVKPEEDKNVKPGTHTGDAPVKR